MKLCLGPRQILESNHIQITFKSHSSRFIVVVVVVDDDDDGVGETIIFVLKKDSNRCIYIYIYIYIINCNANTAFPGSEPTKNPTSFFLAERGSFCVSKMICGFNVASFSSV
jgi:hypothetical protein